MKSFNIDGTDIVLGEGNPPLLLPDIGTYFDKDISLAELMMEKVQKSGCTFIKGEILHNADICFDGEDIESYYNIHDNTIVSERYRSIIERKIVSLNDYEILFKYKAREFGLNVALSVYDFAGVDFAESIGAKIIKIASSNIVHAPLIRYAASKNIPLIIDTGRSTMEEVFRAINWVKNTGYEKIIIEYSQPSPPSNVDEHNLGMLKVYKTIFDIPVGLSDHHVSDEMLYAATAIGASVLEFGISKSGSDTVDHDTSFSKSINSLRCINKKCNNIYEALHNNSVHNMDIVNRKINDRMGMIASKDIMIGDAFSLDNVTFAFPAIGIPVEEWDAIDGSIAKNKVVSGNKISWNDVKLHTK